MINLFIYIEDSFTMTLFSERMGYTPKKAMQIDDLDKGTRNGLWNCVDTYFYSNFYLDSVRGIQCDHLKKSIWMDFFKQRLDQIPYRTDDFKNSFDFYKCSWHFFLSFLEFIAKNYEDKRIVNEFTICCNRIFERESVGHRFIGEQIVPIISPQEITEVEKATNTMIEPINSHIIAAIKLFGDRENPDFRNSIKESISAVECVCQIILGKRKTTLGDALGQLETKGLKIHPALRKSFESMYGWTNTSDGIRHALIDEPTVGFDDAKYMLVSCSAFVNYLIAQANKVGINLQENYRRIVA